MERTRVSCLWEGVTEEKGGETGQAWGGEACVEGLSVGSRIWPSGERASPGRKRRRREQGRVVWTVEGPEQAWGLMYLGAARERSLRYGGKGGGGSLCCRKATGK